MPKRLLALIVVAVWQPYARARADTAARRRIAEVVETPLGAAILSDEGERFLRAGAALLPDAPLSESLPLSVPAITALLLMDNNEDNVDEFIEIYEDNRAQGLEPHEAVEYALAGLQDRSERERVRREAKRLGLTGTYADVAAAFGASDPRGPRTFALAYAAQRQALARSEIDDADRFAPELAHEGTQRQTDTWTGEPISGRRADYDPFTLLYYHWVVTRGHGGSYGWEPVCGDSSWSGDRGSWLGRAFGGWGGGGGFGSGGNGGSSWGGGGWSGGGGGFGGGGGGGGGGGSGW